MELPEFGFDAETMIGVFLGVVALTWPGMFAVGLSFELARTGAGWVRRYFQ